MNEYLITSEEFYYENYIMEMLWAEYQKTIEEEG